MILPILTYGSNCWFANVEGCRILENIQKKSLVWINGPNDYRLNLKDCNVLPISLYLQILDLLFLSKIMHGHYDINIEDYLCLREVNQTTRSSEKLTFNLSWPNKVTTKHSFFYRTEYLVNKLPNYIDFGNPVGLKNRLINYFWQYFDTQYQENSSQTWRI